MAFADERLSEARRVLAAELDIGRPKKPFSTAVERYEQAVSAADLHGRRRSLVAPGFWVVTSCVVIFLGIKLFSWFPFNYPDQSSAIITAILFAFLSILPAVAVLKLGDRRFPNAVFTFAVVFFCVGVFTTAIPYTGTRLKIPDVVYVAGSSVLLAGVLIVALYVYWRAPVPILRRRILTEHLGPYLAARLVDAAGNWSGKWPIGSYALDDCRFNFQHMLAQSRRTGIAQIDAATRVECWRIAEYVKRLATLRTFPGKGSDGEYENEIASIVAMLNSHEWKKLPRVEESPSWFDRNRELVFHVAVVLSSLGLTVVAVWYFSVSDQMRAGLMKNLLAAPLATFAVAFFALVVSTWTAITRRGSS